MKQIDIVEIVEGMYFWNESLQEWKRAKKWSKMYHPAWLYLATQRKRPEIRETYRKKVLEAYRNKY
jgi:hypothetical protein